MIEESALNESLTKITRYQKKIYEALVSNSNEIAAIRETVRALDPTFAEVLEEKRTYYRECEGQAVAALMKEFDSLIHLSKQVVR